MKMYLPPKGDTGSRRGFLKKGLLGGAVLALGGGSWLFTRKSAEVTVPSEVQNLRPHEYSVIVSLVQRFAPVREGFPSSETLQTALACDRIISLMEDSTKAELKQLINLFENALPNFLFGLRTRPFTQLPAAEQEEVLGEWRDSKITVRRSGYVALRGLVMAAYYGNKATWAAVGYPGPLPGIHDPNAPVWKGGGAERPMGNGRWIEPATPEPAPGTPAPAPASPAVDGGTP